MQDELNAALNCLYCKFMCERHTSSNAIATFVIENFRVGVVGNNYLGWKHRLAPDRAEWLQQKVQTTKGVDVNYDSTLFVFTVRHPLGWLRAMHREPYAWHQPELKELPFERFLQNPIEDYRNPMVMWNQKYRSYLRLANEIPFSIFLRLEDFAADQYAVYQQLKGLIPAKGGFSPLGEYISGKGIGEGRNVSDYKKDLTFSSEELSIVKEFIDLELVERLGYDLEAN